MSSGPRDHPDRRYFAGHVASVLALPFNALVVSPLAITWARSPRPGWGLAQPGSFLIVVAGAAAIAAGLTLMALAISLFFRVGRGMLAPWDRPTTIVRSWVSAPVRLCRQRRSAARLQAFV